MFADMQYFLYGVGLGFITAFGACYVALSAMARMVGCPSPTGRVVMPAMSEPLPFHIKDDNAEAREAAALLGRDSIDGLGR